VESTVGQTGIYNLSKDEAPALVHLEKGEAQQRVLVRFKQPNAPQ
jgi:hypothetical protein